VVLPTPKPPATTILADERLARLGSGTGGIAGSGGVGPGRGQTGPVT
jgi:hypothetical protein